MKVINLQNYGVVVIRTELSKEAILKLQKHVPQALKLTACTNPGEFADIFAITFGKPYINEFGISFDRTDDQGRALITVAETLTNAEVAEKYITILRYLQAVETQALGAYAELEEDLMSVINSIGITSEEEETCENNEQAPAEEVEE